MINPISNYITEVELNTNLTFTQITGIQRNIVLDRHNLFTYKQIFTTPRGATYIKNNAIESNLKVSITRTIITYIRKEIKSL